MLDYTNEPVDDSDWIFIHRDGDNIKRISLVRGPVATQTLKDRLSRFVSKATENGDVVNLRLFSEQLKFIVVETVLSVEQINDLLGESIE